MNLASLRQLRYPAAFRIRPRLPPRADFVSVLARLAGTQEPPVSERSESAPGHPGGSSLDQRFLAALCTCVWSLRRRMLDPTSGKALPEFRRTYVPVREMWNEMSDRGVAVVDHTGEAYDPGQPMTVRTIQAMPGLESERVVETVRPTIFLGAECIQVGEVVVGAPEVEQHLSNSNQQSATEL